MSPIALRALRSVVGLAFLMACSTQSSVLSDSANELFLVTTFGVEDRGCDNISVVDVAPAGAIHLSQRHNQTNPIGRIAATASLSLAVAEHASNLSERSYLSMLVRDQEESGQWWSYQLYGANFALSGGIEILTDNSTLIVASVGNMPADITKRSHLPPYEVQKFMLNEVTLHEDGTASLGPKRGSFETASPVAEIIGTTGSHVHVLTEDMVVHTIDSSTMRRAGSDIQMSEFNYVGPEFDPHWLGAMYADVSNDGQFLVANRWFAEDGRGALNIADLTTRTSRTIDVDASMRIASILRFNRQSGSDNVLAINTKDSIVIGSLESGQHLEVDQVLPIGTNEAGPGGYGLSDDALDWSGNGQYLVASSYIQNEGGVPTTGVLRIFSSQGQEYTWSEDLSVCESPEHTSSIMYIHSSNAAQLPPSVRIVPTATATVTMTAGPTVVVESATPAVTSTLEPTSTPLPTQTPESTSTELSTVTLTPDSVTPAVTATATAFPTGTHIHEATVEAYQLHLPLLIVESCPPANRFIDVVLVVDTSSSMRGVVAGKTKLEHMESAVHQFLSALRLRPEGDRAAVVSFHREAIVRHVLSSDEASLKNSVRHLDTVEGSRLDLGIRSAVLTLATSTRGPRHSAIVLLTDGLISSDVALRGIEYLEDDIGKDAITVLVDLSGESSHRGLLMAMVSGPDDYFHLSDARTLGTVYLELSRRLPCSPIAYWGRR